MILALLTQQPLSPSPLTSMEVMTGVCHQYHVLSTRQLLIPQEPQGIEGRVERRPGSSVEGRRWFEGCEAVWKLVSCLGSRSNVPVSQGKAPTGDL